MSEEPEDDDASFEATRMSLGDHLAELRTRLIRGTIALGAVLLITCVFYEPIGRIVLEPGARGVRMYDAARKDLYEQKLREDPTLDRDDYFAPASADPRRLAQPTPWPPRAGGASTGFFVYLKACLYFTLFIGGPYALWELWQFIAAGLYKRERRLVQRYFPFSVVLFLGGVLFGYFVMVPYAYYLIPWMTVDSIYFFPDVDTYFTFLRSLSLALGAVFQLPLVMIALCITGMVEPAWFASRRGHFAIVALVIAAILTPPDPFTQVMMAGPMILLYELGLVLARLQLRRNASRTPEFLA